MAPRLNAHADPAQWVPVTGSLGFRGRRHRKAAIRMLLGNAGRALGGTAERPGNSVLAWAMSQAAPLLLRRAGGRVLVWVWKDDPEVAVVLAQLQVATNELRTARAMMPMEFDDTDDFPTPHLGTGERLVRDLPKDPRTPPYATYTWDTGSHFVTLTVVGSERERFSLAQHAAERIARDLRIVDDMEVGETEQTFRIEP